MLAKQSSRSAIFHELYERRRLSKQMLCDALDMSLPTVSQGLLALQKQGLVAKAGTFSSTGGRPATAYAFCPDARYGMGVELVADRVRLAAVNLYGLTLRTHERPLAFRRSPSYFDEVADLVFGMVQDVQEPGRELVGITIAIQGIVDAGRRVTFGGLLGPGSEDVSLDDFHGRFPVEPSLIHDVEAAAYAELWRHREMRNFVYLSLNDHLGSALVLGGELLEGGLLGAGVVEHMVLHPMGPSCYCGNRGCAETTLGARALERGAHRTVDELVAGVRSRDPACLKLWECYLDDLALLIHNVRMVACADVIIGGRVAQHLREQDLSMLKAKVASHGVLSSVAYRLVRGHFGGRATTIGAALRPIDDFLATV